jgi:hypothetical protein
MTEQTEREAFEKVYEKLIGVVYKTPWKFERESWDENRYKDDSVQFSWEIWQARAQQPIAQECDTTIRQIFLADDTERLDFLIDYCCSFQNSVGEELPENSRRAIDAAIAQSKKSA